MLNKTQFILPQIRFQECFFPGMDREVELRQYAIQMSSKESSLQNDDIQRIIMNSPFEAYSLEFYNYFYTELLWDTHLYFQDIDKETMSHSFARWFTMITNRSSKFWTKFIRFLEDFTNIEEVISGFLLHIKNVPDFWILYTTDPKILNYFSFLSRFLESKHGNGSMVFDYWTIYWSLLFARKKNYIPFHGTDPIKTIIRSRLNNVVGTRNTVYIRSDIEEMVNHWNQFPEKVFYPLILDIWPQK